MSVNSLDTQSPSAVPPSEVPAASPERSASPLPTMPWWLAVLSILPLLSIPAAHMLSNPQTASGLFHYELPYYVANGRAAFERGNGLLYPNPYDASVDAPVIYAHWLPWCLGVLTALLNADPGMVMLLLTAAAALLLSVATWHLLLTVLPDQRRHRYGLQLAAMWGGGLLVAVGVLTQLLSGRLPVDPLVLDPGQGLWFLNWGRNALFPTEAVYHALTAACWIAELRQRRLAANVFLLLLATTHPWSGLELLLTINLWRGLCSLQDQSRTEVRQLLLSAGMLIVFLSYYQIWLPQFTQHAELQSVWELDWSVRWSSAFPAWGVLAGVILYRLFRQPELLKNRTIRFLLCALLVATGLSLHDRVIKPVQPLHFTRGYVWMPLFLLAAPVLVRVARELWRRSWQTRLAAAVLALMMISDNFVFCVVHGQRQLAQQGGFHLDTHARALMLQLHERFPQRVVLTDSPEVNYLLPAYASLRPWLGHQFNTPDFPTRQQTMRQCLENASIVPGLIPPEVTVLALNRDRDCRPLSLSRDWTSAELPNAAWQVWIRQHGTTASRPRTVQ